MDLGRQLDTVTIQTGIRELNRDINFDVANRLEDVSYVMAMDPRKRAAIEAGRLPVCWNDRYICSLDRDMVSEFKWWGMVTKMVEEPSDGSEDFVNYERVSSLDRSYPGLASRMQSGDRSCTLNSDGTITRYWRMVTRQVKGSVLRLGWRHTFENLIAAGIPGVTRESISAKFGVDMFKYPAGSPEEIVAALRAE